MRRSGALPHSSSSEEETERAGADLAGRLAPGSLLCLIGDLGSGKTVFVRGLAAGLGLDRSRVSSPSYVLAIEHHGPRGVLLHVDLYRLPAGADIGDLGIDETLADGGIVAVEWGERLPPLLAAGAWRVTLGIEGDRRSINITPPELPR